jgi:hypothetical protein
MDKNGPNGLRVFIEMYGFHRKQGISQEHYLVCLIPKVKIFFF